MCDLRSVLWDCAPILADILGHLYMGIRLLEHVGTSFLPSPHSWALGSILSILVHVSYIYWPTDLILEISRSYAESEISKVGIPQLVQTKDRHAWLGKGEKSNATCLPKNQLWATLNTLAPGASLPFCPWDCSVSLSFLVTKTNVSHAHHSVRTWPHLQPELPFFSCKTLIIW